MSDEEIKKLQKLLRDEIRPVKELVEIIKNKVDSQGLFINVTSDNVRSTKEQQYLMNDKLDEHRESLVTIENKINIYGDMYKLYNDSMNKLAQSL